MSLFIFGLVLLFGAAAGLTREYISVNMTRNWTDAQWYCRQNYRGLATITTDVENKVVYELIASSSDAWIGMYKNKTAQTGWLWSDETSSSFSQWEKYQPNNNNGNQNCVAMFPDGWNDKCCNEERIFVCYQFLVLVKEKKTWEEACDYCRMNYTGLASLTSKAQLQFAELESRQTQTDSVWTGLNFVNGKWLWVSTEPLGNLTSLPSCPAPNYRCGAYNTNTHIWENRACNEKLNFLCYY